MKVDAKNMAYYFSSKEKYAEMPHTVYHYCSIETLFHIITNSTIRLSNIAKSNDAEEITYIVPHLSRLLKN